MFTYLHNRYFDYSIKNPLPQATDLLKLNGILAFYYRIIFRNMYHFTFFVSFRNMYPFTFFVSFVTFRNMCPFTFFVIFVCFVCFVSFISLYYLSSFLYCSQTTSNILPRLHLDLLQGEFPSWSQALHLHYLQG